MNWSQVNGEAQMEQILSLFKGGAKLISAHYTACTPESDKNNLRTAELHFLGRGEFSLKFTDVDCLHIAPIAMGNINVENVALGKFRNLIFWADDASFDITEPDTSLSYVIARGLFIGK